MTAMGVSDKRESRGKSQAIDSIGLNKVPSLGKITDHYSSDFEFTTKEASNDEKIVQKHKGLLAFLTEGDKQWLSYLTIISFLVRLAFLNHPSVVVFDEVHFGGFARKYLNYEFFSDLHPPLARLLVTLSAWVGNFDAKFTFYDIGADYLKDSVPYVTMRAFTAISGALVVPIAYSTMRAMSISVYTAVAVSVMIIFENALTTQSRLILLDSYLVLFTTLIGFFWVIFQNQQSSREWKISLVGLGTSMALAASCKWVGLFAVVAIGLYTIVDLWNILGDGKVPLKTVGKHFVARSIALIVIPILIYAGTFWIHFALLGKYSPAAASYSIEFQQTLKGGKLPPTMAQVYYGSTVRIRQYRPEGVFLHSHGHGYPAGSKQQQITGYHHRDQNNLWVIRRPFVFNHTYVEEEVDEQAELKTLRHSDELRLQHLATGRFLHSHQVEPPVSNKEKQFEVSGYGHHPSNFSDYNDNWRIEIVDERGYSITEDVGNDEDQESPNLNQHRPPVLAIGTKFRLAHRNVGCKLHSRNKALPDWGFKQAEITCGRETLRVNQIWVIESNEHPSVDAEAAEKISFKGKGFWGKFFELNKKMWDTNAGLSAHHPFGSRPDSWPFLLRGIGFWNGNHVPKTEAQHLAKSKKNAGKDSGEETSDDASDEIVEDGGGEEKLEQARLAKEYIKFKGQQIYLLGNPVVWWSSTAALAVYFLLVLFNRMAKRRNLPIASKLESTNFGHQLGFFSFSGFMFVQWLWHFVPFFGMRRQLFLHHYLPALYFALLLFAILLDAGLQGLTKYLKLTERNARRVQLTILAVYMALSILVFWKLAPLGYGLRMGKTQCESLKWLKRWDFDCNSLIDPVSAAIVTSVTE